MNLATWKSIKSPIMQEIRVRLKQKNEPGQPTPSRKTANRVWREDILGIKSEEQKSQEKQRKQQQSQRRKQKFEQEDELN